MYLRSSPVPKLRTTSRTTRYIVSMLCCRHLEAWANLVTGFHSGSPLCSYPSRLHFGRQYFLMGSMSEVGGRRYCPKNHASLMYRFQDPSLARESSLWTAQGGVESSSLCYRKLFVYCSQLFALVGGKVGRIERSLVADYTLQIEGLVPDTCVRWAIYIERAQQ